MGKIEVKDYGVFKYTPMQEDDDSIIIETFEGAVYIRQQRNLDSYHNDFRVRFKINNLIDFKLNWFGTSEDISTYELVKGLQ